MKPSLRTVGEEFARSVEKTLEQLAYCEFGAAECYTQDSTATADGRLRAERKTKEVFRVKPPQGALSRSTPNEKAIHSSPSERLNALRREIHGLRQRLRGKTQELDRLNRALSAGRSDTNASSGDKKRRQLLVIKP